MVARLIAAPGLLLKDWGENTAVVYASATVSTHLVSADAARLLRFCLASASQPLVAPANVSPDAVNALLLSGLLHRVQ
ncbi:MAG: hypothetical protein WAQ05_20430 [Rubrivivax sp.]